MSLILIDGSALFYRAHYAFANRPLTAPNGEITSVAFGFFSSILRLIEQHDPAKIAVVFDVKGRNFRHEIYPDYKANRKPMPSELAEQLPRLRELLDAWGIAVLEKKGVEADDVIGTMVRRSAGICEHVWLYSSDKDFMQLLDARIGMLKPARRGGDPAPFTGDDVRREYKLEPASLKEVFALAGDSSDNIPGAPGIGDKTARKLIQEFGSLESLYEGLEKSRLTPRLKRVLGDNKDQVFMSRDLFVIRQDVEIDVDWDKDVREDTYRASGAGGQHVNKTSSAVRLTHLPTGIVVQCQSQRSQHKNRAQARKVLSAKIYQFEQAKRDAELAKLYGDKGEIAFGNQIRSYVLYPYQLVRDERTELKNPHTDKVLDGDIQQFIDEYLRHRAADRNRQD